MGKREKTQAANVGRVPLVQDGKPLLYPRYNTVEDLLNIEKMTKETKSDELRDIDAGNRPSKKQKRARAADEPSDEEQAAGTPAGKGYGTIGEDGLTYKQRRQLRRAAERAQKEKENAEAEAARLKEQAGDATTEVEAAAATPHKEQAHANGSAGKKKDKRKDKRGKSDEADEGAKENGAANGMGPTDTKGNADEAARMRAVLGFTSTASGGGRGGLLLTSMAGATAGDGGDATAAAPSNSDAAAGRLLASETKKQESHKKDKMKDKEVESIKKGKKNVREVQEQQHEEKAVRKESPREGTKNEAESQHARADGKADGKAAAAAGRGKQRTGAGLSVGDNKVFSFNFQVQPEVEAEMEAKLARLMALDSSKDGFVPRRIWVSGLPHEFDEETVREYWSYCGEVESMHLLTFPSSGNFNGTAYITFKAQEGYEAALACNGEMLEGRPLRVEKCKTAAEIKGKARIAAAAAPSDKAEAGDNAASGGSSGRVPGYPVAYCGNIAFEVGVEELQHLFSGVGAAPSKIRLHADKATGRSKGYAHVHFASDDDVDKAVALDGTNFHGRKIRVSYAQPKPGEV